MNSVQVDNRKENPCVEQRDLCNDSNASKRKVSLLDKNIEEDYVARNRVIFQSNAQCNLSTYQLDTGDPIDVLKTCKRTSADEEFLMVRELPYFIVLVQFV